MKASPGNNILKIAVLALSSFFYIGYLPFIPGTFGSIAGLFLVYLVRNSATIYAALTCALITLGFLFSTEAERIMGRKDAPFIVIDEVCGILLSFIFIPFDYKLLIIGFVVFRILDTLKPYPADTLQRLKGNLGIMADDIVAGLYTNIILQVVLRLASFKDS
jgi:phosphatidylglycerophosphatase A